MRSQHRIRVKERTCHAVRRDHIHSAPRLPNGLIPLRRMVSRPLLALPRMVHPVGGDDVAAFFPADLSFVAQVRLAGVEVDSVIKIGEGEGEEPRWSVDALVVADEYLMV